MPSLRTVLFSALLLGGTSAVAIAAPPTPNCGGVFGLCSYVDASGAEIAPARFEMARQFKNGLAAVRIDGRWGFIQPSGEIAIEPRFQAVGDFLGDRAEAVVDGRAGIIDRAGTFVIPPKFSRAYPFTDDVALVSENENPRPGRLDAERRNLEFFWEPNRLYHRHDGWLTEAPLKFKRFRRPEDGPAEVIWASDAKGDELHGLMDQHGEWVVQPSFGHVQALWDGRAVVTGPKRGDGWGAVDERGEIVIPLKHRWLSYFENGYALLGGPDYISTRGVLGRSGDSSRKLGLIRSDGVIVTEPEFDNARKPDRAGDAPRVERDGIWYALKPDGALERTEPDGMQIASCPQGLRILKQSAGFRLEDAQGRPAFPDLVGFVAFGAPGADGSISGAEISSRRLDCAAPIGVRVGTMGWTYVRADGRALFDPPRYFADSHRFVLGHVVVATAKRPEAGEWGIVDVEGRFTLPLSREPVQQRRSYASPTGPVAVFAVGEGEKRRLTDAEGRHFPDAEKAERRASREAALWCPGGARISGDGERFGIVGPNGETLVPAVHRAISCFRSGVAWAPRDERKAWCPIGVDGAFRDAPACEPTFFPMRSSHSSPEQFSEDRYESNVLWVRANLRYGLGLREERPKMNFHQSGTRF